VGWAVLVGENVRSHPIFMRKMGPSLSRYLLLFHQSTLGIVYNDNKYFFMVKKKIDDR
jgi:hypothetical protein